jgi:hypothetical protein
MNRRLLPIRRRSETFEVQFGQMNRPHSVTISYYDDGAPGEVFISSGKSGEPIEAIARDGAILISLCLQHHVPLDTIQRALTRDDRDQPLSIVSAVVDHLMGDISK